ncbi:MAG: hypothetical protein JWM65_1626, partial [Sphingomonas bacterium]|nr:hypothetical protein [Sphingomonas bacterium]
QNAEQITALSNGGFVVTWTDTSIGVGGATGDTNGTAIKAQVYVADGSRIGTELLVNTATASAQNAEQITALSNGGFVVTWIDNSLGVGGATGDASGAAIKAQVFAADGSRIGTELLVNTATAGAQNAEQITALSNGGFVVTWTDASTGVGGNTGDTSSLAIKAQVYAADGSRIGTELLVNTATAGAQNAEQITALSNGGFVVTWTDASAGVGGATGDTSGIAIKAQVYAADGSRIGTELLVNTATTSDQSVAQIKALANGEFVVTWTDNSAGVGGATGDTSGFAIKAQVYSVGTGFSATEQVDTSLKGRLTASDVDAGSGQMTATIAVGHGIVTATAGTSGATVTGSGTASVTITGTLAQVNALLSSDATSTVVYNANSDAPPASTSISFTVDDGGNTGTGGALHSTLVQTIAITAVNDAPTLTATALNPTFTEAAGIGAQAAAVALFSGTAASAVEGTQSITGLTLTVSGLIDGASEHITIDGTTIALGSGSTGTTATNGLGYTVTLSGGTATIVLTSVSGVSGAAINALVNGITYQDTNADTPGAGDRTVTLTQVHDNGGTATGGADTAMLAIASTVHVVAVNDAPVVDLNGSDPGIDNETTFLVSQPGGWKFLAFIGNTATVTDVDSADFNGGTLTFSLNADPGHPSFSQASDQLGIFNYGTIPDHVAINGNVLSYNGIPFATFTGGTNGTDLVVTLTAGASVAAVQALIQQVDYDNTDSAPQTTDRHVGVTLTDGDGGTSLLATTTIHIVPSTPPANQPPSGADGTVTVIEDGSHAFATSDFGFTDGDNNSLLAVEITTLPSAGTLTDNGVAVTAGQFVSAADIAAGHLVFTPAADANGTGYASFTFQVQDDGGTAAGGVDTDPTPRTLTLDLTAVDDAPVAVADTATTTEAATVVILAIDNDTDVDGGPKAVAKINGTTVAPGDHVTLASGAVVTLNLDGTLGYDPHGAFDYLNAQSSTVDHFSYTLNGGSTADVAVTVTGLTSAGDANHGGAGDDVVVGSGSFDLSQGGNDTTTGGAGNDGFYFGAAFTGADRVDGGGGSNDQIGLEGDYSGGNRLVLGANTLANVEVVTAFAGHSYDITTNDGNVAAGKVLTFYGSTLGANDSFTVDGSAETDGAFRMYGGLGADHFTGGAGDDGFYFGRDGRFNVATDHIDGGAGTNDQFALEGNYNVTISNSVVTNVEVISLLDGLAAHSQYHVTLTDDWTGAGQTHTVYGVPVRDGFTLDASAESDGNLKVYGGLGGDTITTGAGNDWIMGGAGADTLNGGLGADTFFYNKVSDSIGVSHDTILNFDALHDHIDLPTAVTGIDAAIDHGTLNAGSSFDADLTAALAGLNAGHAVQFTADSGTLAGHIFEVIDTNGVAGYQAGQDMVIELQNPVNPITDTASFI